MINFIFRIVLCCSFCCLISCSHQSNTSARNSQFANCAASCETRAIACKKICRNNCQNCSTANSRKAAKNYAHYIKERCVRGDIIALQLNSFRDPLQCRKVTCDCRADFQVCMQACGGVIHKRLQPAPVCC